MKKKIKLYILPLVAAVAALAMFLATPAKVVADAANSGGWSPPVLVILGDSIGTGFGVSGYNAAAVQNQTALFGYGLIVRNEAGFDVRCRAVDGHTTSDLINRLATHEGTIADVMAADIINITIGGNDLRYINDIMGSSNFMIDVISEVQAGVSTELADMALDHLRTNITIVLDMIYALNPNAVVVAFENYAPPFHTVNIFERVIIAAVFGMAAAMNPAGLNLAGVTIISRLNEEVWAERAANYPGTMILSDLYNAVMETTPAGVVRTNKSLFQFDFIHPNAAGHRILADTLMATIAEFNQENMVATAHARVNQLRGNQNELTVTVVESFPFTGSNVFTQDFMINNNAAGFYEVGEYTVFVNTKGNTQIREIFLVA